jgi:hypothetical protein
MLTSHIILSTEATCLNIVLQQTNNGPDKEKRRPTGSRKTMVTGKD